jgi:solute carrier family 25, member 39/40
LQHAVTPLDVVRVRLQAQSIQPPQVDFSRLAITTDTPLGSLRAANLGVTACCREVFFTNNNAEYCMASPRPSASGATAAMTESVECAVEEVQRRNISSTMDGFRKIARNEGIPALWRGLSPTLVMTIPANIIYFTGYDWLRYSPRSPVFRSFGEDYVPLIAGSSARILAATAVSPVELFRTRLQATTGPSATSHVIETFRGVQHMVATQGYGSLWKGLTLTLWRDVPFSGIYWWGYESIRNVLIDMRDRREGRGILDERGLRGPARRRSRSRENHRNTFTDSFIAGATSGAFASVVTMPFDVGKTRTQVYKANHKGVPEGAGAVAASAPEQRSMVRLLWHIFKTEGVAGLWKGWIPRTLKVAPACAIMISSYEVCKRAFRAVKDRDEEESERGRTEMRGLA